jgi:predicted transcriptional regulator
MSEIENKVLDLASEIVAAYVGNHQVAAEDLPPLLASIHGTLRDLAAGHAAPAPEAAVKPVVPVKKSVTPDFLVCLECGTEGRILKRHLATHGLSPDEYRDKWRLPADYPMVAPNYSERRSQMAKGFGLGSHGRRGNGRPAVRA